MPAGQVKQIHVTDILQQCLQLLNEAKLAPDGQAHMKVLDALQQGIIQYIQAVRQQQIGQAINGQQQGQAGQGGGPGGGMAGGMGGGMGGDMGGGGMGGIPPRQIAPGGGQGMSGFGTPNPDELRRTLAGPASAGVG